MTKRRLRLLGPAHVDQIQNAPSKNTPGGAEESTAGEVPRFRSQRTGALLGYLATERRPVARNLLAALFWPDQPPSKGRANLRRELHNLSQILPDCWELDRQAVAFVPATGTVVDVYVLLELEAQERWVDASELLGGEFLEGLCVDGNLEFENWLLGERERWRERSEAILARVIEGQMRRGQYTGALRQTRRLLQLAPWNEAAHRQLMRLLAWTGQRGAALRQFEACRQALWEELGVESAGDTTTLYQQIQAGELDVPPHLPAFLTEEGARHAVDRPLFVGRERSLAQMDAFLTGALAGQGRVIFITGGPGRGKTALMDTFARRAMETHPDLLVASGNCNAYSGLGDPYLPFRDVMAMLAGDVEAKWDAGAITRDHARRLWAAFPLVVQALLDRDPNLLDVFVPRAALLSRVMAVEQTDAPWLTQLREHLKRRRTRSQDVEQSHLFHQVTDVLRIVAQEQPLLLILDDMQWADAASIGLLFHLGRRLAAVDSRVLIACAFRPAEVAAGRTGTRHPLAKVLSEFKRTFGDVRVDLGWAEGTEGRSFVDALLDSEPNRLAEGFRAALFQRTEGHPLFTVELLRAMKERGDLLKEWSEGHEAIQDADNVLLGDAHGVWVEGPTLDWDVLPARVEAVIEERIDRLDPELSHILTIASVEGEVFTAQVVAKVLNTAERPLLRWLFQELERRHRLVRELEEVQTGRGRMSRYRFGHVLFQDYVYKRLSKGERRLLHGDVAAALEMLYESQLEEMAVQLAHHFHQAGDYDRALRYFTTAAERAAQINANDQAITHYTQAIEVAETVSSGAVALARLFCGRGRARTALGEFDGARADYETTLQMAQAASARDLEWRALLDLGRLWASRDYNQTRDYFERALELARRMDRPAVLASSLNAMGNWHANAEDPLGAITHHQEARKIVEQLGERRDLANTLDLLGIVNLLGGDLGASIRYYDQAIALFRELDDRPSLSSSLMGRGTNVSLLVLLASAPAAAPPDALRDITEAKRIAQEIDSLPGEAWANWSLGLLHTVHGQFGRALEVIQSGLRIASEIDHREWAVGCQFAGGVLYSELFAPDEARRQLEGALTLAGELRSQYWIHHATGALAGAYHLHDDLTQAQTCLEVVVSPQTPMDTMGKRYCWVRRAELALTQGDPALALDITDRLIASAPGMSPGRVITFLWKLKAEALAVMGRGAEACALLRAAIENAQAMEERFLLWRLHTSLSQLYCAMNRQTDAAQEFSAACQLVEELAATVPDKVLRDSFLEGAYSIVRNQP